MDSKRNKNSDDASALIFNANNLLVSQYGKFFSLYINLKVYLAHSHEQKNKNFMQFLDTFLDCKNILFEVSNETNAVKGVVNKNLSP